MEILNEEELAAPVDFVRPLHPHAEEHESLWGIPFEWGASAKGTRISISKAKEIASELRAAVAEAETREMRRHFDRERERSDSLSKQLSEAHEETFVAKSAIAILKQQLKTKRNRPVR